MIKKPVYIHITQNYHFQDYNTGIQRTIRQLSKALLKAGINLIPTEHNDGNIYGEPQVTKKEKLQHIAKYDGPEESAWDYDENAPIQPGSYIIHPDISWPSAPALLDFCKKNDMKLYSVFYDAIPIIFKDYYPGQYTLHQAYLDSMAYGEGVMAISESVKKEFLKYGPKNSKANAKIKTILLPNQLSKKRPPKKENSTKVIEMLYVSTINERKNHIRLLRAYKEARSILLEHGYKLNLTFVGSPFSPEIVEVIKNAVIYDGITWYVNVGDSDLKKIYERSDFTIYPSEYEGFGLPIIESLSMNTPVICSNTSSMPEIASDGGCLMFDPYNINEMISLIVRMSMDRDLRDRLVSEIDNIKHRSWDDYAKDIIDFMEKGK